MLATTLAVRGATLIDGTGAPPVPNALLVVSDGRIVSVGTATPEALKALPAGTQIVAAERKWIIPGLIDAHVHAESEEDLKTMLRWGVTSVRLMAEDVAAAEKLAKASSPRAGHPRGLSGGADLHRPGRLVGPGAACRCEPQSLSRDARRGPGLRAQGQGARLPRDQADARRHGLVPRAASSVPEGSSRGRRGAPLRGARAGPSRDRPRTESSRMRGRRSRTARRRSPTACSIRSTSRPSRS